MKSLFFSKSRAGFTILEVMVASAVFIMLLGLLLSTISQTSTVTRRATEKVSAFQGARSAFELITSKLSQATMNSYWDYDSPMTPTKYIRKSELHFVVGPAGEDPLPGTSGTGQAVFFQAPGGVTGTSTYNGMDNLLNAYGYYIEYQGEPGLPFQTSASNTSRYRLMQQVSNTESLGVYSGNATSDPDGTGWISGDNSAVVAENIVYMAIWPRKATSEDSTGSALTTSFAYNSRLNSAGNTQPDTANQLPPTIQLTLVAIDETSAVRFCTSSTAPTQISDAFSGLFSTSSVTQFDADLDTLTQRLTANGVNFRVFTMIVPMRESKMQ
jgi:uncharacterized protein (TIGR02599 family)